MKNNINKYSSQDSKKEAQEVVYESLVDAFFDGVVFINLAYSDLGGGGTTSTTTYGTASRIIDSAQGKLMAPGKEHRLRCQFYIKNPSKTEGYILSPAVYDSATLGSITSLSSLRAYVGLKIFKGIVYVAVKQAGGTEKLHQIPFNLTMSDATFSDTFALEIKHHVNYTDIFIDNVFYGSYTSDLVGTFGTVEIFYPFFAPARSTDGTSVNIVAENIQFIQSK